MSNYTAQDLETLRKQAQEIEKVLAAQQTAREKDYAARDAALNAQREESLRQAYISQQQALTQLPGQLAQAGINGGLAESSLVQLNRGYGNRRADINNQYVQGYTALQNQKTADEADAAAAAAQNRMDYLGAESAINARLAEQARQEQLAEQARQEQLAAQLAAQQQAAEQAAQQQAAWEKQFAALQAELKKLKTQTTAGNDTATSTAASTSKKSAGKGLQHTSLVGQTALIY